MGCCGSSEQKPVHPPQKDRSERYQETEALGSSVKNSNVRRHEAIDMRKSPKSRQPEAPPPRPDTSSNHIDAEYLRRAHNLLKRQRPGVLDEWEKDRWPWVWLYARPPHPKQSDAHEYSDFLKAFRILSNNEAEAYAAWCQDDHGTARTLLQQGVPPCKSPTSPIRSPTDSFDLRVSQDDVMASEAPDLVREGSNLRHEVLANPNIDVASYQLVVHPKGDDVLRFLVHVLKRCPLFKHMVRDSHYRTVALAMQGMKASGGTVLYRVGDSGENPQVGFYIIYDGTVVISGKQEALTRGSYFGEYLVTSATLRCNTTATATAPSQLYFLDNYTYSGVMGKQAYDKREMYVGWLRKIQYLSRMGKKELVQLADALEERRYHDQEKIIVFGEVGDCIHFIVEGVVEVWGRNNIEGQAGSLDPSSPKYVCSFEPGHPIGFLEFFNTSQEEARNIADVIAKGEVITARIDRKHFEVCMGSVKDLLEELTEAPEYEYYRSVTSPASQAAGVDSPESAALANG
eukprot:Sspe_Gene.37049::Locus_17887_Transcript_1_1_Confidence_1.000_Length_1758::g.37049::m.37049/K04739/PRKAR; cAMP-dependent protein kinase regulator